jgi:hypothetical protein
VEGSSRLGIASDDLLQVSYARSEMHLTEVLETICNKMDDYVRATYKTSGELTLLRLIGADGQMNPDLSHVDIVQDSDLNKSLKFYVSHTDGTRSEIEVITMYIYLHLIFVTQIIEENENMGTPFFKYKIEVRLD